MGSAVVNSSLTNVGTLTALTVSGATNLNGGLAMDTNKFTVADATGNVATAGTLNVTGLTTLSASANIVGDVTIYDSAASASPTLSIGKDASDELVITATTDGSSRLTGVEFATDSTGTIVTRAHSGKPCRLIDNAYTRSWASRESEILPYPLQVRQFGEPASDLGRIEGDIENGVLPAGQSVGLIREVKSAGDVVRDIVTEAEIALKLIL